LFGRRARAAGGGVWLAIGRSAVILRTPAICAAVLALVCGVVPEVRADAIVNPGFEQGQFVGWTVSEAPAGSLLLQGGRAHSGRSAAWFGAVGGSSDSLAQTFAVTPGEQYALSFWLAHGGTNSANAFTVLWDGLTIFSLVNAGAFGYREFTFVTTPDAPFSTLEFSGREMSSYYRLDDVHVVPVPTPEPATIALIGGGLILILRRRHSSSSSR
jgi:hypothetical protein